MQHFLDSERRSRVLQKIVQTEIDTGYCPVGLSRERLPYIVAKCANVGKVDFRSFDETFANVGETGAQNENLIGRLKH
jgi:hypothetical protein